MTDLWKIWGARVREARVAAGLKQRDLSAMTGIPQQTISMIETGASRGTDTARIAIAAAIGVDANELFAYPDGVAA